MTCNRPKLELAVVQLHHIIRPQALVLQAKIAWAATPRAIARVVAGRGAAVFFSTKRVTASDQHQDQRGQKHGHRIAQMRDEQINRSGSVPTKTAEGAQGGESSYVAAHRDDRNGEDANQKRSDHRQERQGHEE